MTTKEEHKKIKEKLFCDSIATFVLSVGCADMFFVNFDIEYFANNIMWFVLMVGLIVSNIHSLAVGIADYKYFKESERRGKE